MPKEKILPGALFIQLKQADLLGKTLIEEDKKSDKEPGGVFKQLKSKRKGGSVKKTHMMPSGKNMKGETHKDVKKAFMGLAVEAARKSPMGLIGVGADKILKKSGTAREAAGSLGMGGKLLKQYYDKEDSKSKTTGSEQTGQVTAKRMGGMVRGGRAEIKGTRPAKLT